MKWIPVCSNFGADAFRLWPSSPHSGNKKFYLKKGTRYFMQIKQIVIGY